MIRTTWCPRCVAQKPLVHRCHTYVDLPKRPRPPCQPGFHTYPPGSSRCRACAKVAGDD